MLPEPTWPQPKETATALEAWRIERTLRAARWRYLLRRLAAWRRSGRASLLERRPTP
jgi:hypothetical protein